MSGADRIMERFATAVEHKHATAHGAHHTKDQDLSTCDAMAAVNTLGTDYQAVPSPMLGSGMRRRARPPRNVR